HDTSATRHPHSFPTRRSSDLNATGRVKSPSRINAPPTVSIQPAVTSSGVIETPGGMPPNQPNNFIPPGQMNSSPATILSSERVRSEEHTSELQSRGHLVCRLL